MPTGRAISGPAADTPRGSGVARSIGSRWDTIVALRLLGDVARDRGDLDLASTLLARVWPSAPSTAANREIADSLSGIGIVAVAQGQLERAARLFSAAEALYRRLADQPAATSPTRLGGGT